MKPSTFLRTLVVLTPFAGAIAACDRPDWTVDESATVGGSGPSSGGSGTTFAGAAITAGTSTDPCAFDRVKGIKPIFAPQTINTKLPARMELYALVTDAEAQALREGGSLIPPVDAQVVPDVVKLLDRVRPTATPARQPLIDALKPRFASVRAVWPNAWALRLVEHAGSEHMNVVRIVLREGALFARITEGSITALNEAQKDVLSEASMEPERVAVAFYETTERVTLNPNISGCEDGRRVMVLGDEAMIEEWSLGTNEVLERQEQDLALIDEFFKVARACGTFDRGSPSFRAYTVCQTWPTYNVYSEYTAYQWALSTPNELYKPTTQNLAGLIEALQADRFEPDPYLVKPEPPEPSVGGAGNEGGAAGAGGATGGRGGAN